VPKEEVCTRSESVLRTRARVAWRVSALLALSVALFVIRLPLLLIGLIVRPLDRWSRERLLRLWGKGALAIAGVRVTVEGTAPKPPFIIVSNHLSYVDVMLLAGELGCAFVAKADVARWFLVGWLAKAAGTIFIDRSRIRETMRVNQIIIRALEKGLGIHVFAEGSISPGVDVQPFKSPLLEPAAQLNCPVHYAAITYSVPNGGPPASEVVVWRAGTTFAHHVFGVLSLRRVDACLTIGEEPISDPDRKALADRLWHEVQRRFTPVR